MLFKKIFIITLFALISCGCNSENKNQKVIGLTQIASHPSLNAVAEGVRKGLTDLGWKEGENLKIIFRNANRDPNLTLPIAESFVKMDVDVIVPITTPSTISAVKATSIIPIVFVGVSDPIGTGIVTNYEHPGKNITGSSDQWPFEQQIDLFLKIQPELKKLGLLYSPGDDVSIIALNKMKTLQKEKGFELVAQPISSPSDVYSATRQLLLRVDAVYTGTDNLIVENLTSVLKAANEAGKPVYSGDEGSVEKGALATYSISMFDLGYESASLIDQVLKGKNPGEIPILIAKKGYVTINKTTLEHLNMTLPENITVKKFVE
ncbi:MAG: ABC transporter substrate-binding protein [Ignavibacteria bacterium]